MLTEARIAVSLVFLLHGILVSNWLARIPAVQTSLGMPVGVLGLVLLGAPLGAMAAMPLTSKLVGRYGSARITRISTLALCAALPLPALARNAWMLGAFLVIYGAAAGAMDVAMNTQAVDVERGYGKPVMVSFHALFSFGGMLGSLMGSAAAARHLDPAIHLALAGGLMAAIALFAARGLLPHAAGPARASGQPVGGLLRPLLGLSAIAFCVLVGEGAMADWSAVYLNQLTTAAFAPVGYAVFSLTMAGGRLAGDWLHEHLGAEATVRAGSALAAAGLAGALALGSVPATLIGFACVGVGYSSIFPIVCSVAGRRAGSNPQAGIAAVAGTGYLGFLVGPPIIGLLAQMTSLRAALGAVAALSALTAALAPVVRYRVKSIL